MTSMWGFSVSLGRQPWPLGIYNFFQMEKWEEVNIFMQSRTFQKPSFICRAREQSVQLCAEAYRLIRDHSITVLRYSLTSSVMALTTRVGWQQSWVTLFPKREWTRRKVRWGERWWSGLRDLTRYSKRLCQVKEQWARGTTTDICGHRRWSSWRKMDEWSLEVLREPVQWSQESTKVGESRGVINGLKFNRKCFMRSELEICTGFGNISHWKL